MQVREPVHIYDGELVKPWHPSVPGSDLTYDLPDKETLKGGSGDFLPLPCGILTGFSLKIWYRDGDKAKLVAVCTLPSLLQEIYRGFGNTARELSGTNRLLREEAQSQEKQAVIVLGPPIRSPGGAPFKLEALVDQSWADNSLDESKLTESDLLPSYRTVVQGVGDPPPHTRVLLCLSPGLPEALIPGVVQKDQFECRFHQCEDDSIAGTAEWEAQRLLARDQDQDQAQDQPPEFDQAQDFQQQDPPAEQSTQTDGQQGWQAPMQRADSNRGGSSSSRGRRGSDRGGRDSLGVAAGGAGRSGRNKRPDKAARNRQRLAEAEAKLQEANAELAYHRQGSAPAQQWAPQSGYQQQGPPAFQQQGQPAYQQQGPPAYQQQSAPAFPQQGPSNYQNPGYQQSAQPQQGWYPPPSGYGAFDPGCKLSGSSQPECASPRHMPFIYELCDAVDAALKDWHKDPAEGWHLMQCEFQRLAHHIARADCIRDAEAAASAASKPTPVAAPAQPAPAQPVLSERSCKPVPMDCQESQCISCPPPAKTAEQPLPCTPVLPESAPALPDVQHVASILADVYKPVPRVCSNLSRRQRFQKYGALQQAPQGTGSALARSPVQRGSLIRNHSYHAASKRKSHPPPSPSSSDDSDNSPADGNAGGSAGNDGEDDDNDPEGDDDAGDDPNDDDDAEQVARLDDSSDNDSPAPSGGGNGAGPSGVFHHMQGRCCQDESPFADNCNPGVPHDWVLSCTGALMALLGQIRAALWSTPDGLEHLHRPLRWLTEPGTTGLCITNWCHSAHCHISPLCSTLPC